MPIRREPAILILLTLLFLSIIFIYQNSSSSSSSSSNPHSSKNYNSDKFQARFNEKSSVCIRIRQLSKMQQSMSRVFLF